MSTRQPQLVLLTDAEWQAVAALLPPANGGGRRRDTDLRAVINGILYKQQQRCPWRKLPAAYPPWQTVRYYYDRWQQAGVWLRIATTLRRVRT